MSEAILENGSSGQNGSVTKAENGTPLIEDSTDITSSSTSPQPEQEVAPPQQQQQRVSNMVTTTTGGGGSSGRKSDTVHRVTFVECNNTEHGPPSSEDTENESYTSTVIKSSRKTTTSSIVKPSHHTDSKHNGELQPLMVNSSEFTDSGYTDSIISGHDSTMHSSPHNGDVMDGESPEHSAASSGSPNKEILKPVLRLTRARSTESHDNPFLADGELCKKADTIIRHSTISRTELKVFDPDTSQPEPEPVEEVMQAKTAGNVQAARPQDVNVKQNGNVEDALTPQSVEVEVAKANASQPEAQKAEEVKVEKDKKCACCVIQ